jgi:hypothetical protein
LGRLGKHRRKGVSRYAEKKLLATDPHRGTQTKGVSRFAEKKKCEYEEEAFQQQQ